MTDTTLDLTFAELAALCALQDKSGESASTLGVPPVATDSDVFRAGLSSLVVRGLAQLDGDVVELTAVVSGVASALGPERAVTMARLESSDSVEIFQVRDDASGPVVVQLGSAGVFTASRLAPRTVTRDFVWSVVASFAGEHERCRADVARKTPSGLVTLRLDFSEGESPARVSFDQLWER